MGRTDGTPLELQRSAACIVEALTAHICVLDERGDILSANRAWRRFGKANPPVPRTVFVGDNYLAVCDRASGPGSEEAAPFAAGLRRVMRCELDKFVLDYPCHAPGARRWFVGRVTRLPGDGPLRVVVAHEEITQRMLAEEALRESEAAYRGLFENSLMGISQTSADGRLARANRAYARMYGYHSPEEMIAEVRDVTRKLYANPAERVQVLRTLAEHGVMAPREFRLVRRDGSGFVALVSAREIRDRAGELLGHQAEHVDISDRKRAEEESRQVFRDLLSAREDQRRRLSAILHHDVGSFTMGVASRLQAAEEDLGGGQVGRALTSLRECRELFDESVKRLKALAADLRPPDLDLLGLRVALRQHLRQVTCGTRLDHRLVDATHGRAISGEAELVAFRVVQECVNNVQEHAGARRVTVRLSVSHGGLRVSVADDGRGFDPTRVTRKTGPHLGLRAMTETVAAHGGSLQVVSRRGVGTRVVAMIPLPRIARKPRRRR